MSVRSAASIATSVPMAISPLHLACEVLDRSPLVSKIYARFQDARHIREDPLDPSHAGGASHPRDGNGDPRPLLLLVDRFHAELPHFALVRAGLMLYPPTLLVKLALPVEASLWSARDTPRYIWLEHERFPVPAVCPPAKQHEAVGPEESRVFRVPKDSLQAEL
jgi:hypothetical protein